MHLLDRSVLGIPLGFVHSLRDQQREGVLDN
jgi:hypothetical protein